MKNAPDTTRSDQAKAAALEHPLLETREQMLRGYKAMSVAERFLLLDRLCSQGTRLAMQARRVK